MSREPRLMEQMSVAYAIKIERLRAALEAIMDEPDIDKAKVIARAAIDEKTK